MTDHDNCDCSTGSPNKAAQKLFDARTIVLCGEINQKTAKEVCENLLAMAAESDKEITIVLNSQGGHVESGDTIHDMIKYVKPKVRIIGTGWVASAGAHIYLSVPKNQRYSLPNTRYMIHQPAGGVGGSASDMEIEAHEIIKMRKRINHVIAEQTGQPFEKVEKDTDRNYWLSADEAKAYGIVGKIIHSPDEL